jgi:5-(carboxyamino)imidazole ribonucleotide synthase
VSVQAAEVAEQHAIVRPSSRALQIAQHRMREKAFVADLGLGVAPFAPVRTDAELIAAVQQVGTPAVLKTARLGYDGKGQMPLVRPEEARAAWDALDRRDAVLESFVDLEREISVIAARGADGEWRHFEPIENTHRNHILDVSVAPSGAPAELCARAVDATRRVMDALEFVGLLCIEFFITRAGTLLVNELAPRPHNSGHLTFEACRTSQFEQQLRAVCGLPLGAPDLLQPAAMANLLGDLWEHGDPRWSDALKLDDVKLHLYGKTTPRGGRKMGHLTAMAATRELARARVLQARAALTASGETHGEAG